MSFVLVTAKKILGKKFPEKSPKISHLKSPVEKSPFIKKSTEIKSYQFETFFLAPVWFYTKKSSEKKSSNKWKCMIHRSRFFFSSDFFSSGLFSWNLISWDFIGSPHTILGKNSPRNPKHRILFPVTFFQGLEKIRSFFQRFYFQVIFPETFFPGTFLHRFGWWGGMYLKRIAESSSSPTPIHDTI